jgi:hypothetical protein
LLRRGNIGTHFPWLWGRENAEEGGNQDVDLRHVNEIAK